MRILPVSALMFALCAAPAFSQTNVASLNAPPAPPAAAGSTTLPADASNPSVDYTALRETVARQNKVLNDQLAAQRAIVKKNQELLKEAQKLQTANLKLADEMKKLEAQNADLNKQRETLKAAQKPEAN